MDLVSAVLHDRLVNKMNKKQEWICEATYISGHPDMGSGNRLVVIKLNMVEMAVHKKGFWKGLGDLAFKIPINKIISVSGDGTYYPFSDDQFTQRPLTVTVLAEDNNGNQYNLPIKFNVKLPWMIIPKLTYVVSQSKGIKI
jgi:hypothetical protein